MTDDLHAHRGVFGGVRMKQIRLKDTILTIRSCRGCPIINLDLSCGLGAGNGCLQHLKTDFPIDCPLEDTPNPAILKEEQMKVLKTINDAFVKIVSEKQQ